LAFCHALINGLANDETAGRAFPAPEAGPSSFQPPPRGAAAMVARTCHAHVMLQRINCCAAGSGVVCNNRIPRSECISDRRLLQGQSLGEVNEVFLRRAEEATAGGGAGACTGT